MRKDNQTPCKKCAGFIVNTNGTVLDNTTNLTWQQEIPEGTFNWKQAKEYASQLNLGGYNDWRIPTREELQSLVDFIKVNPAIDVEAFPTSAYFWSSSPLANSRDYAWYVGFSNGFSYNDYSFYYSLRVRCVR